MIATLTECFRYIVKINLDKKNLCVSLVKNFVSIMPSHMIFPLTQKGARDFISFRILITDGFVDQKFVV